MGLPQLLIRLRDGWIDAVLEHRKIVLVLGFALTFVSILLASRLELDSNLRRLLPKNDPVVQRLEQIEEKFGALGSVDVVVRGATIQARHAFADALAKGLEGHEMLSSIDHAPDKEFFLDHALYYLSDEEMEELGEHIGAAEHQAMCSAAPDVCVTDPDPEAGNKLRAWVKKKRGEAEKRLGFGEYYERDGIDALVVFLRPNQPANNLDFDKALTEDLREKIATIHAAPGAWQGLALEYNLIGPYVAKGEEQKSVPLDMARSGALGLLGITLVLFWLFRSWRAVFSLLLPLCCGVAWSMGITQIVLGHLNTMTSMISTVVLGMGIDAGIHLMTKVQHERAEHSNTEAIRRALRELVVPMFIAASTTVGAFCVMATTDFPAFQEFGLIGGFGIALCLLAMTTVFPALLAVTGVRQRKMPAQAQRKPGFLATLLLTRPSIFVGLAIGLSVLSWFGFSEVRNQGFETNGRLLGSDRVRTMLEPDAKLVHEIFLRDNHPSILLVDSYEQLKSSFALAEAEHSRRLKAGESVVTQLVSATSVMPDSSIDLAERQETIEELGDSFSDSTWKRLERGEHREASDEKNLGAEDVKALQRMLAAQAFTVEDIPAATLSKLRPKTGGWAIFAYPDFDRGDILKGASLMDETRAYSPDAEPYVGEATIFAAMYMTMTREWSGILGLSTIVVIVLVVVQLRSIPKTLMTMLPLLFGLWWLLGFMGLCSVRFTLFNVPIFPAVLGIGVDHGVYLTVALMANRGRKEEILVAVRSTGRAIWAASATTAIGFGSFMIADSGGIRGVGEAAVIGVLMAAVSAMLILPTLSVLTHRTKTNGSEHS